MAASHAALVPKMTGMGGAFLLFYEAETGYVRGANGQLRLVTNEFLDEYTSPQTRSHHLSGTASYLADEGRKIRSWMTQETSRRPYS